MFTFENVNYIEFLIVILFRMKEPKISRLVMLHLGPQRSAVISSYIYLHLSLERKLIHFQLGHSALEA